MTVQHAGIEPVTNRSPVPRLTTVPYTALQPFQFECLSITQTHQCQHIEARFPLFPSQLSVVFVKWIDIYSKRFICVSNCACIRLLYMCIGVCSGYTSVSRFFVFLLSRNTAWPSWRRVPRLESMQSWRLWLLPGTQSILPPSTQGPSKYQITQIFGFFYSPPISEWSSVNISLFKCK